MDRKYIYAYRILRNFIQYPFIRLLSARKIQMDAVQIIASGVSFRAYRGGRILLKRRNNIESNVLLETNGGEIHLQGCFINRNSIISSMEKIVIEQNVTIGPNVCIYDHDHNTKLKCSSDEAFITKAIYIDDGVWIGANASILKGVHIARNAIVAAGSIVTHDVPENAVVAGVPAIIIKYREV